MKVLLSSSIWHFRSLRPTKQFRRFHLTWWRSRNSDEYGFTRLTKTWNEL
jgi:hypothetical protein